MLIFYLFLYYSTVDINGGPLTILSSVAEKELISIFYRKVVSFFPLRSNFTQELKENQKCTGCSYGQNILQLLHCLQKLNVTVYTFMLGLNVLYTYGTVWYICMFFVDFFMVQFFFLCIKLKFYVNILV